MNQVKILSGVSGCGKSTMAGDLFEAAYAAGSAAIVVSADDYFMVDDEYKFDPAKLSQAHGDCFRRFLEAMWDGDDDLAYDLIIVDNTNTTAVEIAPYVLGAQAFHYDAEIITFTCQTEEDVKLCAARNSHGVPFPSVMGQHCRLKDRVLMPWWKHTYQPVRG